MTNRSVVFKIQKKQQKAGKKTAGILVLKTQSTVVYCWMWIANHFQLLLGFQQHLHETWHVNPRESPLFA